MTGLEAHPASAGFDDPPAPAGYDDPPAPAGYDDPPAPAGYDELHPPEKDLLDECVHCGFCLPTCPTYVLWGEEMDSPRGRIYLMNLVHEGAASFDDTLVGHFDTCLGCMACVTSCPSGVQYDRLLESMRPQIERNHQRGRLDRAFRSLIFALFPYPGRLRAAALGGLIYQRLARSGPVRRGVRRLPSRLRTLEALVPPVRLRDLASRPPARIAPIGVERRRVALLTGCVQRVFFNPVNQATARVLAAEGCTVLIPREQGCCGALSEHAGREEEALERARRTIDVFERHGLADLDAIVVNVAGCGSTLKEYGTLLRDDPQYAGRAAVFSAKVRDVTEVLAELEPRAPRHPITARAAYHDACHLGHAQKVREQPRSVLRTIPELELVDIPEAAICCGSAGVFNLLQPDAAEDLGRRKVDHIRSVHPDLVATANPGCLLQIRRYLDDHDEPDHVSPDVRQTLPLYHPVELVDASIRGVDPMALAEGPP